MKRIIAIGCLFLGISFLSGCATMGVIHARDFPFKMPLPKILVIGDISLGEKVKLPQEEINKGREILYVVFKKELPEYQILMVPPIQGDYLTVETKITFIRESHPVALIMSGCNGELSIFLSRQNETPIEILKTKIPKSAIVFAGLIHGRYGAYYGFFKMAAQKIALEFKKAGQ